MDRRVDGYNRDTNIQWVYTYVKKPKAFKLMIAHNTTIIKKLKYFKSSGILSI